MSTQKPLAEALLYAAWEGIESLRLHGPQLESDEEFEAFMDEAETEACANPLVASVTTCEGSAMNINMKVTARKEDVLEALRQNREDHQVIVREAREGYMVSARAALSSRLEQLASGKLLGLFFDLHLPADHTNEYTAAIRMLELHQGETVELDDVLVRCLVLNQWAWSAGFISSNSPYSSTARRMSEG